MSDLEESQDKNDTTVAEWCQMLQGNYSREEFTLSSNNKIQCRCGKLLSLFPIGGDFFKNVNQNHES